MAPSTRLTITLLEADPELILRGVVQQPEVKAEHTLYAYKLVGWVVGRRAPVARVELIQDGKVVLAAPVDAARRNVANRFPETPWAANSGFRLHVDALTFPATINCELRAVFADGVAVPIATIQGQREPVPAASDRFLQPLMVTSLGRSGSTWQMRLLAEHPAIVAYRRYPYEMRPGLYWTHLFRVLSSVPDYDRPISHPESFAVDPFAAGPNPFHAAALDDYPDLQAWAGPGYRAKLAAFCQESIEGWYRHLAASQHQPEAAFFAEKHLPTEYQGLLWEMYPGAREVVLVRDFRDVASSALAFNARRGFDDFGRQHVATDEAFLGRLKPSVELLRESWQRRASRAHLVRYEDLITAPAATLRATLTYLGLDAAPATITGMIERAAHETTVTPEHQTSGSVTASIGRWRRDLAPDLQAAATAIFRDDLAAFGYETD